MLFRSIPYGSRIKIADGTVLEAGDELTEGSVNPHDILKIKGVRAHPYTEALLSAIPTTDVDSNREMIPLEGDIPSPVHPPKGCKFHTRCKYCTEICKHITPELVEMRPGHFVACHNPLGVEKDS